MRRQVFKKTDLKKIKTNCSPVCCNFPWMPEVGVQTEDALQCSGTGRLLKNALPKGNFAKYPDPLKLKPDEVPVL